MHQNNRAQPNMVGVILLTAIVVLIVTIGGGMALYGFAQGQNTDSVPASCNIEYDTDLSITHTGGKSIDTTSLDVIYRNSSGDRRTEFSVTGSTQFETGDTAELSDIALPTTVYLVTQETIVCQERVTPSTGTSTETETTTRTETPTPPATATPTPGPTATPTPEPSPGGKAYDDSDNDGEYDANEETYAKNELTSGFVKSSVNLVIPSEVGPIESGSLEITANRIDSDVAMTATNDQLRLVADEKIEIGANELRATNSAVNLTVTSGSAEISNATLVSENAEVRVEAATNITGAGIDANSTNGAVTIASGRGNVSATNSRLFSSGGEVNITAIEGAIDVKGTTLNSTSGRIKVHAADLITVDNANATSSDAAVNVTSTGGNVTVDGGSLTSTNDRVEVYAANSITTVDGNLTSRNGKVNLTSETANIDGTNGTFLTSNGVVEYNTDGDLDVEDAAITSSDKSLAYLSSGVTLYVDGVSISKAGSNGNQQLRYSPSDVTVNGTAATGQVRAQ